MGKLDDLRLSLSFFIKREYFLDWWIGDESLLSILHTQYHLHQINIYYLNRYIVNISLNKVNIFQHKEDYLLNNWRTFFYFFTTSNYHPKKLSRNEYINLYSNFRILCSTNDSCWLYLNKTVFLCWRFHRQVFHKK